MKDKEYMRKALGALAICAIVFFCFRKVAIEKDFFSFSTSESRGDKNSEDASDTSVSEDKNGEVTEDDHMDASDTSVSEDENIEAQTNVYEMAFILGNSLCSADGTILTEKEYGSIKYVDLNSDFFIVTGMDDYGTCGIINKSGEEVLPCGTVTYIRHMGGDYFLLDNNYIYNASTGKKITSELFIEDAKLSFSNIFKVSQSNDLFKENGIVYLDSDGNRAGETEWYQDGTGFNPAGEALVLNQSGEWVIINMEGDTVRETGYTKHDFDSVREYDGENIVYVNKKDNATWYYFSLESGLIGDGQYGVEDYWARGYEGEKRDSNLLPITDHNGLFGYMNLNGEIVIERQYAYAAPFCDGLACVMIDGEMGSVNGCIDESGTMVVEAIYNMSGGYYIYSGGAVGSIVDPWQYGAGLHRSRNGRHAIAHMGEAYGLININGETVVDFAYDEMYYCGEDQEIVQAVNIVERVDYEEEYMTNFICTASFFDADTGEWLAGPVEYSVTVRY